MSRGPNQAPLTPKGPEDYRLHDVEPGDFETLAYLLAHADNEDVVVVRNKDRGLDARLPDPLGRVTLRGWQAKRFAESAIHWGQCRQSLADALAYWRPLRVTFVFAHDLSAVEQTSFQTELAEPYPEVRVDFWSATEVKRRMRDSEEGRRAAAWLFGIGASLEDVLAAMVSKEPVRSAAEIAERQAALQKQLDRDPHFYYSTVARSSGAPETAPAPRTIVSLVLMIDDQEVRYDLAERYPGALDDLGGAPLLVASDDEDGRRALAAIERAHGGTGPARIASGVGVQWPAIPVGLRGLIPEGPAWGPVELFPLPSQHPEAPPEIIGPLFLHAGDSAIGMSFVPLEQSQEGYQRTLLGATGGLELQISVLPTSPTAPRMKLDWAHTLGVGPALDQLMSCRLLSTVLAHKILEISPADQRSAVSTATANHNYSTEDVGQLASHEEFLLLVCELQGWLGRPLEPAARPSESDVTELARSLDLIRQPQRRGTWGEVSFTVSGQPPAGVFEVVLLEPVYATLFGSRVYLGIDLIALSPARVAEHQGDSVRIVPADDATVLVTLQHPDDAPPEAAGPGAAPGRARVLVRPLEEQHRHDSPAPNGH